MELLSGWGYFVAQVVMVTGVSRDAGARCARRLAADPGIDTVIGIDVVPPRAELGRVRFVRADIRNPVIAKVIAGEDVDTVVHTGVVATPGSAGGRSSMKEINVIGTMQLLAACQKAPGVRKLVVKSSTTVYGAGPRDPAMFTEEMAPRAIHQTGLSKDAVEVEGYVRGFARRRPDVCVTTLRMANWIGPQIDSPITRYFAMPVVPTVLGFDARLQFLHENDGVEAIHHATMNDLPGTFNLAGDGVLSLSQAIRRLGRPALRLPSFTASSTAALSVGPGWPTSRRTRSPFSRTAGWWTRPGCGASSGLSRSTRLLVPLMPSVHSWARARSRKLRVC